MKSNYQIHIERLALLDSASPSPVLCSAYEAYVSAESALLTHDSARNYTAYEAALNHLDTLLQG